MLTIGRGQHGSTYGGNPVAARVAVASLRVLQEEGLVENAARLGPLFRAELEGLGSPLIKQASENGGAPGLVGWVVGVGWGARGARGLIGVFSGCSSRRCPQGGFSCGRQPNCHGPAHPTLPGPDPGPGPPLHPRRAQVRGRGLLNAVVIDDTRGFSAWDVCLRLMQRGLLTKPTHRNIIRLAPPLVITESELLAAVGIIKETLEEMAK